MAKIISIRELVYDARGQKSGTINVEISNWAYDLNLGRYLAQVNDFVISAQGEGENTVETRELINSKQVTYQKEEIDQLFVLLGNEILLSDNFSEKMDQLISGALLFVTQQDPIYGSVAEDWITADEFENRKSAKTKQ